jgi:transketolase
MEKQYFSQELSVLAKKIRQDVMKMLNNAGSGHSASSLGMADIFTALYFEILKHDPKKPDWPERDYLILSAGHICPVLYASLAEAGYFPKEELETLRQLNSRLQGHPHYGGLPGIENTSGPLGQGLSQAAGLAYGLRLDGKSNRIYCVMSDGEHQEGQTWEAYMFAGVNKLTNLTVLADRNNIQISGSTDEVMSLEPFADKIKAFGWQVIEIDGHNFEQITNACNQAKLEQQKPTVIICRTVPGKGVSFMENDHLWHGKAPDNQQLEQALKELNTYETS